MLQTRRHWEGYSITFACSGLYSDVYPDQKRASVMGALHSTIDWYAHLGIRFKAVLTDNGPAYRSLQFAQVCRQLGLKHRFTRP